MRYFGPAESATLAPSPVPVGKLCAARCGHLIGEGDVGFLVPGTGDFDSEAMTLVAGEPHSVFHRSCLLAVLELDLPEGVRDLLEAARPTVGDEATDHAIKFLASS